jgi:protein TonB
MKKIILFTSILTLSITVFSSYTTSAPQSNQINLQDDDYVYDFVEEMPQFPGGEDALRKYISEHLVYPKKLQKAGVKGKVYVSCIIEKDGEVTNEKAYQGIDKKLELEALRLVQGMPNWIPGKHKGKIVRVKMVIPVEFK